MQIPYLPAQGLMIQWGDVPSAEHSSAMPAGPWVMVQRWHDLLFAHWQCSIEILRPLIPAPLAIDTHDGRAWVGVIPFFMSGVRMRGMPPLPTTGTFLELNVRTYVTLDGRPGVWFFSLDCESSLAVIGARLGVRLPYYRATMQRWNDNATFKYESRRWALNGAPAAFAATYRGVGDPYAPAPGSLEHFLTERYSLYSSDGKRIWRGDIVHPRWRLQAGEAHIDTNSMLPAAGVRISEATPLLHFAAFQDVRFWWPTRVR